MTVDSYILQHAACRARLLVATAGFPAADWEELRQELALDCLRRLPKYDNARGDLGGFVRGVMRNHATVLIVRRSRNIRYEVLAGDLWDLAWDDQDEFLRDREGNDPAEDLLVAMDVRRVLQGLPGPLQMLAGLLTEMGVSEICVVTGKSRSRIYQLIRQLRVAFVQAGLKPSGAVSTKPRTVTPTTGK
jgi:RNA polymerase sigma-70 factor, ECF subfamily